MYPKGNPTGTPVTTYHDAPAIYLGPATFVFPSGFAQRQKPLPTASGISLIIPTCDCCGGLFLNVDDRTIGIEVPA